MLRILRSTLTVPASDPGTTFINADITQADLEAAVPVGGSILPLALIFDPEDADVTIKEVVLANTKNEEGQMSLVPAGDALSLAALNKVLSMESGGVDARRLTVAHGARLKIKAVNAVASPKNISILWKVDNKAMGPPEQGFLAARMSELGALGRGPFGGNAAIPSQLPEKVRQRLLDNREMVRARQDLTFTRVPG